MEVMNNVHYGTDKPSEIIYAPDKVYVNHDLHQVEMPMEEETHLEWVATTVDCYDYQEYVGMQNAIIESQKAINQEQDELIAEIIEGM